MKTTTHALMLTLLGLTAATGEARGEAGAVLVDATINTGVCVETADCPCNYACVMGSCRYGIAIPPPCASDRDCLSSCTARVCFEGRCVVPDAGPPIAPPVDAAHDAAMTDAVDETAAAMTDAGKGGGCSAGPRAKGGGLAALLAVAGAALARRRAHGATATPV